MAWLLACSGAPEAVSVPLPVAADRATFATVAGLGSYRLQATVRRSTGGEGASPVVSTELVELRWKDADQWSYVQRRDDRVRSEVLVFGGIAWRGDGDGPLERKGDAEPYRVQLAGTWDPWAWAMEGLASGLELVPAGSELVDGRRALRHTVAALPPPEKPKRGWTVTAAEGDVWIDEATAVRLVGNVRVEATSGARTQEVTLAFSIEGVGLDPDVSPPPGDKP
jgi:hypothetical protein